MIEGEKEKGKIKILFLIVSSNSLLKPLIN